MQTMHKEPVVYPLILYIIFMCLKWTSLAKLFKPYFHLFHLIIRYMSFYAILCKNVLIRFFFFKAMCNNIDVVYRNYNSLVTLILLKWFYISAVYRWCCRIDWLYLPLRYQDVVVGLESVIFVCKFTIKSNSSVISVCFCLHHLRLNLFASAIRGLI